MRRLREKTRALIERLEREYRHDAVPVTVESVGQMERERVARRTIADESRAVRLEQATRLSPPEDFDCPEHSWSAPKAFPGQPPMPSGLVPLSCPGCRQDARRRKQAHSQREEIEVSGTFAGRPIGVDVNTLPPRVKHAMFRHDQRVNADRIVPGTGEEAEILTEMQIAREEEIAELRDTPSARRGRLEASWARRYDVRAEPNVVGNVNAIRAMQLARDGR
jgi:hypothetical protein